MPQLDNYLFFDGTCAEAMRFYERVLGGSIEMMMRYSDAPEPERGAPADRDRIMHASLNLEGRRLMASDTPPGQAQPAKAGFSLSLNYPDAAQARRIFDLLAEGGSVTMPMAPTFWAEAFGMLTDRFGTPWMVGGGERQG
jgi:PhnB protein